MRRIWSGAIAVALLVGVGCSDDDAADPDADQELIDGALLTLDDLPDGFASVAPEPDEAVNASEVCNEQVLDLSEAAIDAATVAETEPVQFDSDDVRIRVEITAFESDDVPSRILDGADDDGYLDCLREEIAARLTGDLALDGVAPLGPDAGDADQVAGIAVGFLSAGTRVFTQTLVARVGRFGVSMQVTEVEGAVNEPNLEANALAAMVERLGDG